MPDQGSHAALIGQLGNGLVPVRRLPSPWLRTVGWLLVVAASAALLLMHFGASGMLRRWDAAPDLAWAGVGAVITTICAAWAAFALSVPGHRGLWAWLPVPGALLWMGASGLGCLRILIEPGSHMAGLRQSSDCLVFIVSFSIPLSALLIVLLRRAFPLRPVLTAVMVGLASAAASASLLEIFHAYNAAATDLLTHALAVALVIVANAVMGGRLLSKA